MMIEDITIRLQIFADNYAKAKLSDAPSVNMRKELRSMEKYIDQQISKVISEIEEKLPKKKDAVGHVMESLEQNYINDFDSALDQVHKVLEGYKK